MIHVSRRSFLMRTGTGVASAATTALLAACGAAGTGAPGGEAKPASKAPAKIGPPASGKFKWEGVMMPKNAKTGKRGGMFAGDTHSVAKATKAPDLRALNTQLQNILDMSRP